MLSTNIRLAAIFPLILYTCQLVTRSTFAQSPPYPANFYQLNKCLYAYMSDGGTYQVTLFESPEIQRGSLGKITYGAQSKCIEANGTGQLTVNFDISDNFFRTMSLDLELRVSRGYHWEVSNAKLTFDPVNEKPFPTKEIQLKPSDEIYADLQHSYSCSSLVLTHSTPNGPRFKITLRRFQLQPFSESKTKFAPSRDCSVWLTMPQIMGLLLILFMIFTVLIGVYLLLELGGHSGELKFSKQGGMLMNQAQLDATKAD